MLYLSYKLMVGSVVVNAVIFVLIHVYDSFFFAVSIFCSFNYNKHFCNDNSSC